ncbi:AbrB/MazE/SpoVT family DNA-binding domain-containing protein [Chelativorans sp.]|uniref:AbrB/MazE/SpoVT family DNA-binding domain-containing protein n=1 Tax=Chelativorans sp. TaxID=2203393 RepID=UPI002810E96C|nr:AbrB/MazE/SpoVT family DNA-binding domain-containing protein [Chelativorans sp.]
MAVSAKMTSKGQITLPAELRKALKLKAGDRVDFRKNAEGNYELVAKPLRFEDLRGIIPYEGPPLSGDDIVKIVEKTRELRAAEIAASLRQDDEQES